jgi:TetR/AcrR family transcriptional regulator, regulator of mycofactocin system
MGAVTEVSGDVRAETRARIEQAALDLFTRDGFEQVTIDEIAEAAGISRRTFFRYFATKADAVWGRFDAHVDRLATLLAGAPADRPVLASICTAYVEVNDYAAEELPLLRERMALILTQPALLAHSQLRYAAIDDVVARYVADRTGSSAATLVPRLVATSARAAATTAFEIWLADPAASLGEYLRASFAELTAGFPSLRQRAPA